MYQPNYLVAFLLGFIPGVGHLYLGRKIRAFLYAAGVLGFLALGFCMAVLSREEEMLALGGAAAFCVWCVNMLDIVITVLVGLISPTKPQSHSQSGWYPPNPYAAQHLFAAQDSYAADNGYSANGQPKIDPDLPPIPTVYKPASRFQTIFLSFIPGLGHFHLGLMNRGLTLLIGFFGLLTMVFFVTILTDQPSFLIFLGGLPIIWLYGLFDAVQQLDRIQRGEPVQDRTIFEDLEHSNNGRRSTVIATLLSLFPGAGHMYLGLQRRGLQLMAGFLFSIYLLDALRLSMFLFLIPLIWFYSFFDALQQVARYRESYGIVEDVPVIHGLSIRQRWFGAALILLGMYYLADQLLFQHTDFYYYFRKYGQTAIVSLLLIGGGLWLLFRPKSLR
jgi:hypothetical protein